jgi:hypothetical protein
MTRDEARELLQQFRQDQSEVPPIDHRRFSRALVRTLERQSSGEAFEDAPPLPALRRYGDCSRLR